MFLRIETDPRRKSNKHTNKRLGSFEWGLGFFVVLGFLWAFFNQLIILNKDTLHVSIYSNGYRKHESKSL